MKPLLFDDTPHTAASGPGLVIDNFAGGGGASTGIEAALGRKVDIAINHDPEAVAMHMANHPETLHLCQSVWRAVPGDVTQGRPVDLAWFSPDCKHFSKAKGKAPVKKNIRDLAWVVVAWARLPKAQRPKVIMLENVEEFRTWGPLNADGEPDKARAGETFAQWVGELRKLGYKVEWKELRACDYGAPTSRKRLFMVARCDGKPIAWPKPTHAKGGAGGLLPWRTAAEIIDWSVPCPSIFERARPLADATNRRIAHGIMKFVVNAAKPFIVPITHTTGGNRVHSSDDPLRTVTTAKGGELALVSPTIVGCGGRRGQSGPVDPQGAFPTITAKGDACLVTPIMVPLTHQGDDARVYDPADPLPTVTAANRGEIAMVASTLVQTGYGEREGQEPRAPGLDKPLGTVVAGGGKHALVAAFMAQHNTMQNGGVHAGRDAKEPISTVTASGAQQNVVTSHLLKLRGTSRDGQAVDSPVPTITAGGTHIGEVRAFLIKYYGSAEHGQSVATPLDAITTKPRFGLVTVEGETYAIADIGMRMLTPRELFRAQGFPDSYIIDPQINGKPMTKTAQVARCGNSVCPPLAEALVRANCTEFVQAQQVAA
jgi:DNA (cytosine-5)-methyltransferase 1